jgi:hypothetical protein
MRIGSVLKHSTMAVLEGALIASLVVGLMAGTALAAKPSGGGGKPGGGGNASGGGSIAVAYMDGATEAHFAARVTFALTTSATPYPYVHLMCYQGGALVGEGRQGFFPTAMGNEWFALGPTPAWEGGAADCSANLEKYSSKGWGVLATTSFHVYE